MELFSHMTVCAQHACTAAQTCLRHDRQCSDSMSLTLSGLGLKGPSMTCDTDGSSSLTAVHLGGEAVLQKGHGVSNETLDCM